jgi:hypothetical protein
MKTTNFLFSCLFVFLSFYNFSQNKTTVLHGVTFYSEIKLGTDNLVLNGGGLREKYFIDLYVGALFLQQKSKDANKILNTDASMVIQLKLVSNSVTREKFVASVKEGFKNASHGKATKEQIYKFISSFDGAFKKGDKINFEYTPDKGVVVEKNGKQLCIIEGLEFKKALFSIWLGSVPADSNLKEGMLGKE